jgi:hypothetical protein
MLTVGMTRISRDVGRPGVTTVGSWRAEPWLPDGGIVGRSTDPFAIGLFQILESPETSFIPAHR